SSLPDVGLTGCSFGGTIFSGVGASINLTLSSDCNAICLSFGDFWVLRSGDVRGRASFGEMSCKEGKFCEGMSVDGGIRSKSIILGTALNRSGEFSLINLASRVLTVDSVT